MYLTFRRIEKCFIDCRHHLKQYVRIVYIFFRLRIRLTLIWFDLWLCILRTATVLRSLSPKMSFWKLNRKVESINVKLFTQVILSCIIQFFARNWSWKKERVNDFYYKELLKRYPFNIWNFSSLSNRAWSGLLSWTKIILFFKPTKLSWAAINSREGQISNTTHSFKIAKKRILSYLIWPCSQFRRIRPTRQAKNKRIEKLKAKSPVTFHTTSHSWTKLPLLHTIFFKCWGTSSDYKSEKFRWLHFSNNLR